MAQPIEKIIIDHFRGASCKTELKLDIDKPVIMFFGENGTGKSTIVDAIDFIANESKGSISDRSSTKSKDLSTIGCKTNDIFVELVSGSNRWKGSLAGTKIEVQGPVLKPKVHILRRSQLLSLIEAEPSKRYSELRKFIDVDRVEKSEQALRDAVNAANTGFTLSAGYLQESENILEKLWKDEGSEGDNYVNWAKRKTSIEPKDLKGRKEILDEIASKIQEIRVEKANLSTTENNYGSIKTDLEAVNNEISSLPSLGAKEIISLVDILQKSKVFIEVNKTLTTCPVCEQFVEINELSAQIDKRLGRMKEYRILSEKQKKANTTYSAAKTTVEKARNTFVQKIDKFITAYSKSSVDLLVEIKLELLSDTDDKLVKAVSVAVKLFSLQEQLTTESSNIQKDINQFNAIKGHLNRIKEEKEKSKHLEILVSRLSKALEIVQQKRIRFTQDILDNVSSECDALFQKIHPGESLGKLKLALDEKKKGSLHQQASFEGHDNIAPQAYFSESHLDTYGFCVWLAIAKRDRPKDTILILDDVFTSVDSVHLTRIVNLLADECKNFCQVIVTTHYRNWRDRYRYAQGPGNSIQLIELHRWSLQRGIKSSQTKLAIDELESKLKDKSKPLDRQSVSSEAGILLEAILDDLALLYRCRLPRSRDNDYTLGELIDGVKKLLKKLTIEKMDNSTPQKNNQEISLTSIFDEICKINFIRNQVGCHFNPAGTDIADTDVELFSKKTVELARSLCCPQCGEIARRKKDDCFICSCGKTKMTPIEFN